MTKITTLNTKMDILNSWPKVVYISSYVPRKCGIATFTKDLTLAANNINPDNQAKIIALMDELSTNLEYPQEVVFKIRQSNLNDYKKAAEYINKSKDIDMVCLQHEYGIYGGDYGNYVLKFINQINKPIITTLHTVVSKPDPKHLKIIKSICKKSTFVIVMLEQGAKILESEYNIPLRNVVVIPHGVPNFINFRTEKAKKDLGLEGKIVMTSINLVSHYKGIEFAIKSLPEIVKHFPNFIYQVVGETHPNYLKQLGGVDTYRNSLKKLAKDLGVENNIRFVNKYVSLEELVTYVESSDFYVTPYIDPEQITSGALAYAVGAGKVCISTPYLYAKEILGEGRGIIVPFEGSKEIAQSVIDLIQNPEKMREHQQKTYRLGKFMTWPYVASQYVDLFRLALLPTNKYSTVLTTNSLLERPVIYLNEIRR